jgi:uncharacterized protein (DUF697 family)
MNSTSETTIPIADRARQVAPVVWLLGKVQSGKTSIVRTLTQATDAEIGEGFRACTTTARVFDFPSDAPIIRFLDTRGLGEVGYDPTDDIAFCERRSHVVLAVVKALDPQQQSVLDVIAAVRKRHPDWPLVVAQTNLHEGYATGVRRHVLPYPFAAESEPSGVPEHLMRALAYQRDLFKAVAGGGGARFAPLDFTQPQDHFDPPDYGREALIGALIAAAPAAVAVAIAGLPDVSGGDVPKPDAHILGFAVAAAASDAVPVAGAVAVPMVQAAMLHRLAALYGVDWDQRAYAEFAGALGIGTLVRTASAFGIRQLVKLVPVYGQTAGAAAAAAASFAATYAMGKAAAFFLTRRRQGAHTREVANIYAKALREAFLLAKARDTAPRAPGSTP